MIESVDIDPKTRAANVHFHTAEPAKMTDLLFGSVFDVSDPSSVDVAIPCGMFRLLDIELKQPLMR